MMNVLVSPQNGWMNVESCRRIHTTMVENQRPSWRRAEEVSVDLDTELRWKGKESKRR